MQQLLPAAGPRPLLLWRSTTSTSTPQQDSMYGKASATYAREAAEVPPWRLWDVRALTQQAQLQGMQLRWDDKHYLAVAYEVGRARGTDSLTRTDAGRCTCVM